MRYPWKLQNQWPNISTRKDFVELKEVPACREEWITKGLRSCNLVTYMRLRQCDPQRRNTTYGILLTSLIQTEIIIGQRDGYPVLPMFGTYSWDQQQVSRVTQTSASRTVRNSDKFKIITTLNILDSVLSFLTGFRL